MSDRCYLTVICAAHDADVFEKMGYSVQDEQALTMDGDEIPGGAVMIAEQADNGNYDDLTALKGVPFVVCNGSCSGAFGEWHYSEALHESNYPAVRVEPDGIVQDTEVDDARTYWRVHKSAISAIKAAAAAKARR